MVSPPRADAKSGVFCGNVSECPLGEAGSTAGKCQDASEPLGTASQEADALEECLGQGSRLSRGRWQHFTGSNAISSLEGNR